MLGLDLGVRQGPGQAEAGCVVGQGAILPKSALDLAGGGREAGRVITRGRQPVDRDIALGAEGEGLSCGLSLAVEDLDLFEMGMRQRVKGIRSKREIARIDHSFSGGWISIH